MKAQIKRIFSCLLAVLLVCGAAAPCFAAAEKERVPVIFVPGFMSTDVYRDVDDPGKGVVWPPATEDILKAVRQSIPALTRYAVDRNADKLCDDVIPRVNAIFEDAELDADGKPKGNTGVIFEYPEADEVKKDSVLTFRYDWRIDPMEVAAQLNDFIDYVCECAGTEQVSLECHSYGGVVTVTYLTLFGNTKIKNAVFNSTAVFGESFNGGLLSGQIHLTGDAIVKYIRYAFTDAKAEALLNGIFDILGKAGLLDLVCGTGNRLLEDLSPRAVPECVAPLFAGWLSIWSMIPDEFIDGAMQYVFTDCYKNDGRYDGVKAKVEAFNETVRPHKTETLLSLNEAANLFVIARYGWSSIPVTPYYNNQSDGSIDLKYASFGATCAEYGETLPDEYLAGAEEAYVSPDKSFDASTCLFPEQTWFIRDLPHGSGMQGISDLIAAMTGADAQETVDTLKGYSRFMLAEGESLLADPGPAAKLTFIARIKAFFQKIVDFIKSIFRK